VPAVGTRVVALVDEAGWAEHVAVPTDRLAIIPDKVSFVSAATLPVIRKASTNDALIQRFKTDLNLSPDQTDKIAMVLADYREYYHSLEDQLDDVRSTGKSRIMQILDDQQRTRFEKMMVDLQPQLEAK